MVRKLRRRVAAITICSVFIVLSLIIGLINAVNYINKDRAAESLLDIIAENGGGFPQQPGIQPPSPPSKPDDAVDGSLSGDSDNTGEGSTARPDKADDDPASEPDDADDNSASEPDDADDNSASEPDDTDDNSASEPDDISDNSTAEPDDISDNSTAEPDDIDDGSASEPDDDDYDATVTDSNRPGGDADYDSTFEKNGYTPETPFETRYFTVSFTADGTVSDVNTGNIAAIDSEEAVALAERVAETGKSRGYVHRYKYRKTKTADGTMYIFLDCSRDLGSVMQFLRTSILIAALAFCGISSLVILLSPLMIRPITESYEKQKSFITNAGHELKTPLAAIESCNDVIEMESGETKWTKGIRSEVHRLNSLTQELVELARMDERGYDIEQNTLDLSELAGEVLGKCFYRAENCGLRFDTDIRPGIAVMGNRHYLTELIDILADNALKYSPEGATITFTLEAKGRSAVLTASNPAKGLTVGKQNKFFDRFYRGNSSRSAGPEGYGIGLSMAQSIVSAHNGKIDAFSGDGKILTITVKLPVKL